MNTHRAHNHIPGAFEHLWRALVFALLLCCGVSATQAASSAASASATTSGISTHSRAEFHVERRLRPSKSRQRRSVVSASALPSHHVAAHLQRMSAGHRSRVHHTGPGLLCAEAEWGLFALPIPAQLVSAYLSLPVATRSCANRGRAPPRFL